MPPVPFRANQFSIARARHRFSPTLHNLGLIRTTTARGSLRAVGHTKETDVGWAPPTERIAQKWWAVPTLQFSPIRFARIPQRPATKSPRRLREHSDGVPEKLLH